MVTTALSGCVEPPNLADLPARPAVGPSSSPSSPSSSEESTQTSVPSNGQTWVPQESPQGGPAPEEESASDSAAAADSSAADVAAPAPASLCGESASCVGDPLHTYIVRFRDTLPAGGSLAEAGASSIESGFVRQAQELVEEYGGVLLFNYRMAPAFAAQFTPSMAQDLRGDPRVAFVETGETPIVFHTFQSSKVATQWNALQQNLLGLVDYAALPHRGTGIGIAMIDTGVDATHPDLQYDALGVRPPNTPVAANHEMVFTEAVPTVNSDAAGGHGTHVAGIMVGQATPTGRLVGGVPVTQMGLAPGAHLYVFGAGEQTSILWATEAYDALLWSMDFAAWEPPIRVVQNSWGAGTTYNPDSLLTWQINQVVSRDAVVVFSTGNAGGDGSTNQVGAQCQIPTEGVVCVGGFNDANSGTRSSGTIYTFSSRGARSYPATWPDLVALATNIQSTKASTSTIGGATVLYGAMSGTSVAAPMVSAAVALMLAAEPTLLPHQVETCLERTAYKFSDGGSYEVSPDPRYNGSHFAKGHGLVDFKAAVLAADYGLC